MKKTNESGRSMVEMLGVLAIIGVLSVAGIAGYTTAMNKHRANQILSGASVRAIVVSTQIQRGSAAPKLVEFTDADNAVGGATFTGLATWNKDTDKRFSLTLENVPAEVCTQMKAMKGENGIIRKIDDGCTTITYNNDLSPNDPEPSGPKGDECTDSCSGGATCVNGYCQCAEGIWQPSDNSGNGECKTGLTGDCTTNADCKEAGKYCKIEGSDCNTPNKGTCITLDSGTEANYNGKTFLYSSGTMTWWAARNWCLAHGKSLVSPSDISCTVSDEARYCTDWDNLETNFGNVHGYYWITGNYRLESCFFSFYIDIDHQMVSKESRSSPYYWALCQ